MKQIQLLTLLLLGIMIVGSSTTFANTGELPDNLIVAFDHTHDPALNIEARGGPATWLEGNLTEAGSSWKNIESSFAIPSKTNVLLFASPNSAYSADELTEIDEWFSASAPRLLWLSGDSDFDDDTLYPKWVPDHVNGILEKIGSNLRAGAGAISDSDYNDGRSYRPAATQVVSNGTINSHFTHDVESVIFHSPTYVLGYQNNAVVDLLETSISGVEIVMKMSENATAADQDFSTSELDYYTENDLESIGGYPVMVVQDMGNDHYVIVTGEPNFTDYKNMYGQITETGTWNNGTHDGKTLVDNVMTWFGEIAPEADESDSPLSLFGVLITFALLPVLLRRKLN